MASSEKRLVRANMEVIKQVIVIRKDLKMRRGKEVAQGSHASMIWLVERIKKSWEKSLIDSAMFSQEESSWLTGLFTKVCLQVDSEEELLAISEKARLANLNVHIVTDSGLTEFGGVPTKTCCAIGPNKASEIDLITGHLKLY